MNAGNLISGSSALSKTSLNIWKFLVHVLLNPGLENFEHYFTSVWDECNYVVVWTLFVIAFLWDWNENWPFAVLWPLLSFPNLLTYWVQHFHSITGVGGRIRGLHHVDVQEAGDPPGPPVPCGLLKGCHWVVPSLWHYQRVPGGMDGGWALTI